MLLLGLILLIVAVLGYYRYRDFLHRLSYLRYLGAG